MLELDFQMRKNKKVCFFYTEIRILLSSSQEGNSFGIFQNLWIYILYTTAQKNRDKNSQYDLVFVP